MKKMTFALCFCNRGFMPGELIYGARDDMVKAVTDAGYDYIMMDKDATRYGAVETRDEGRTYAKWLKSHEGEYDGVILCMPIFVDENGAIAALQDAGVPILMQVRLFRAYLDEKTAISLPRCLGINIFLRPFSVRWPPPRAQRPETEPRSCCRTCRTP